MSDPSIAEKSEVQDESSKGGSDKAKASAPIPVMMELALMQNMSMLQQFQLADPEACTHVSAKVHQKWAAGEGADPIDVLIRMRAAEGAMMDSMVEMASLQMARSLPEVPSRVPFAAKLIPPNGFYEKWPEIKDLCQLMMVPIAYAEDMDVIGLASINPYFVEALAEHIREEFTKVTEIEPIIHMIRLDRISWMKMNEKHFPQG